MRATTVLVALLWSSHGFGATHDVTINSLSFDPPQLTIATGDTVKWTLVSGTHTTTSDTGVWNSPTMNQPGATFSFTFQNSGSFPYHCAVHGFIMSGTIIVSQPKIATTTTLESSPNPTVSGQNGTLTATVTKNAASNFSPGGSVTFNSDGSPLCSNVTLSGGTAACSTAPLAVGGHSITADYSGDANFSASSSTTLVHTVNEVGTPAAPAGLSAFAPDTVHVVLSWAAVSGATSYEVHRKTAGSDYSLRTTSNTNDAVDSGLTANTTYVYKVRALGSGGTSAFSAADAATTIVYIDSIAAGTFARAIHIGELRTGVNAMRAAAGLGAATFTNDPLTAGTVILATHLGELRTALDAARSTLTLPPLVYSDAGIAAGSTIVRAAHVTELRDGTR
jgi:plastocyanin